MVELIKNEIGDNKISTKIGEINSLENKIKDSYKEIYETWGELQDLKKEVMNNLSGKTLKELLEKELTIAHVKMVLQVAIDNKSIPSDYSKMDAGVMFNMQLALAKLGCHFHNGIDAMYGKADTGKRIKEFQNAWNVQHPEDMLPSGQWSVNDTMVRMMAALDDPKWNVSLISGRKVQTKVEETTEVVVPKITAEEAIKDRETMLNNHLEFMPQQGYEFVDPTDPANIATKVKGKRLLNTPFMSYEDFFKDPNMDKYHLGLTPSNNHEWANPQDDTDVATKLREGWATQEDKEDEENTGTITSTERKSKIRATEGDFKEVESEPMPAQNVYGPEEPLEGMNLSYDEAIKDRETMERNHLHFEPQEGYEWAGNYPDNLAVRKIGTMVEDSPMISHADVLRYLKEGGYPVDIKPERGYTWLDKSADDNYATTLQKRKATT